MCSRPVRRSHGVSLKANVVLDLTAIPPVNRPCLLRSTSGASRAQDGVALRALLSDVA
jgi:hypothetical protein